MQASAQFWDKIADKYAAKPIADLPAYEAKLDAVKALLSAGDSVLDLGCGTGSLALELAPLVSQVHAVDFSPEMIRVGQGKAKARGVHNVTFHMAPLDSLPSFDNAHFDMICAFNVLHLIDDLEGLLQRVTSLIKPGGHFVSSTPCLGDEPIRHGVLLAIAVMRLLGKAPDLVRPLKADELRRTLQDAGLRDVTRKKVSADRRTAFLIASKGH